MMGAIVVLVLLVAVVVGAAQGLPDAPDQGQAALATTESMRQVEETAVICVILISGTALLAGMVWVKRMQ
jgi:hypothetical protein